MDGKKHNYILKGKKYVCCFQEKEERKLNFSNSSFSTQKSKKLTNANGTYSIDSPGVSVKMYEGDFFFPASGRFAIGFCMVAVLCYEVASQLALPRNSE